MTSYAPHFEKKAWGNSKKPICFWHLCWRLKLLLRVDETQYALPTAFIRIVLFQGSERTRRKDKEALAI